MIAGGVISTVADTGAHDVLSVTIGAVCTAAVTTARWLMVQRLPARRTWRFESGRDLLIIASSSAMVDSGSYQRPVTGIGQMRALSILSPSLRRAYRDADLQRILLSAEVAGHELDNNLLLLGGPKTNVITRELLDRLAPRLPFTVIGTVITWNQRPHDGPAVKGRVVHDYGYVVRAIHPLHPRRRVVIVAGSHTFGTAAAARWLADNGGSRHVPAEVAVLIEADVTEKHHVGAPQVLDQMPLMAPTT